LRDIDNRAFTDFLTWPEILPAGETMYIVKEKESNFALPPECTTHSVLIDFVDLGEADYYGRACPKGRLVYQLSEAVGLTPDGKRFTISRTYPNLSLHKDSTFRTDLEDLLGRRLKREEVQNGFDVESLLGTNAVVTIEHNQNNGKTYANIVEIRPVSKDTPLLKPYNYIRVCDRKEGVRSAPRGERGSSLGYRGSRRKAGTLPDGVPPVPSSAEGISDEDVPF
jgi:hypothetical protein